MAQTRKKRRRKHAGTQAGTVERRGRTSKPGEHSKSAKTPAQARAQARADRLNQPPTWRGSIIRAAVSAVIFAVVVVLAFGQRPLSGLALGALMFVLYIPMSYYLDRFLYNRRQRQKPAGKT